MEIRSSGPILILAWISGCFDALSFLGPGRVFTANMTGNTVLLGLGIAQGNLSAALHSLVAVAGFSLGVLAASFLVESNYTASRPGWSLQTLRALLVESGLLLIFALTWLLAKPGNLTTSALIAVAALAMGQQSAIVTSLGFPGISTTYISGTITTLMANLGRRIFLAVRGQTASLLDSTPQVEREHPARLLAVWLTYLVAAVIAGYGELHFTQLTAFLPFATMGVLLVAALLIRQASEKHSSS